MFDNLIIKATSRLQILNSVVRRLSSIVCPPSSVSCLLHLQIVVNIPRRIEKPILFLVLLYRRLRCGCAFRRIPLTQGKFAIVDPDDYSLLSRYKWHASKNAGTFYAKRNAYSTENASTRAVCMHRRIMNAPDDFVIDHINYNGLDNRKANLRLATRTQNNRHTRITINPGTSKYKGVSWYKREKRWAVRITADGKTIPIGYFKNEIEAALAYDHAAKKYHREFAALNFPEQ
jgi:hypothetical protein